MLDVVFPTAKYVTTNQSKDVIGYHAYNTTNAYLDTIAKNARYALLNNIIGKYDGTYWKPINDATKILSGDFQVQVPATDIGGVAGNGLIYTGENSPFDLKRNVQVLFNVRDWSIQSFTSINDNWTKGNLCESRGMFLPTNQETSAFTIDGVPNNSLGYTWSASTYMNEYTSYSTWNLNSFSKDYYGNSYYVRCVR